MNSIKAKLPQKSTSNARNLHGDKEQVAGYTMVTVYKGEFSQPVRVRVWQARSANAQTVYASIWVNSRKTGEHFSGHGSASGYGYDKVSTAIEGAIQSAGIVLTGDVYGGNYTPKRAYIGGCGETATLRALYAITRACGYRKMNVVNG